MKNTKNTYEIVTEKIVELLAANENPWTKPWVTKALSHQKNLFSMKAYNGLNAMILAMENRPNDFWLSYKQGQDLGFTLKQGSKSSIIIGWFKGSSKVEKENDDGETETKIVGGLCCRYFRVFNLSDFDGVPDEILKKTVRNDVSTFETETVDVAEKLIIATKAKIGFGVEQACYRPKLDEISMPDRNRFPRMNEYYSTMFHELGHWTGHETRLKRAGVMNVNRFGSTAYSQEELVAEMTSVFVCSSLNISNDSSIRNSVAYLQSWMKFVKNNPKAFTIACQQGQKAADLIVSMGAPNDL